MSEITIINEEGSQGPKNFSKGYLTFPFDGNQFKDFISGLLGKPQSIYRIISGTFEIHLSDLQNFYELVNQRVTQQNNGQLIQFTAKIYFGDRSVVQLGSYAELVTFNEVKPIISDAVKLTWDYLIQFSDKKHPEKQSIELLIISTGENAKIDSEDLPIIKYPTKGEFRLNIQHTARSWGSDIESLLSNQINSLLKTENKFKKFIRKYSGAISLISALLFLLTCIIGAFLITNSFIHTELDKVQTFANNLSHSTDEKINFLTHYIASGISAQHYFKVGIFLLVSVILSIIFGAWISTNSESTKEVSFVVLTRKAKENRDAVVEKMKRKWMWFFISVFVSILSGVISNFIFKALV